MSSTAIVMAAAVACAVVLAIVFSGARGGG
jgi:hypothetical protein